MVENKLPATITALGQEATEEGICSGAAIGLTSSDPTSPDQQFYFGHLDQQRTSPVTPHSLFDLASLTKPLATTLACLALVSQGTISLSSSLAQLLPEATVSQDKKAITLAQLLSHRSGLPAYRPYYLELENIPLAQRRDAILNLVLQEPLQNPPDQQEIYSDLGFILLGESIRQLSGKDLQQFCRDDIFSPLNLADQLLFCPKDKGENEFVATEQCPWRHTLLRGEVHDQNCWAIGGVSGQAGLFAPLGAVLKLLHLLLQIQAGQASHPAIATSLLQNAMASQHGPHSWGLGFDTPDQENSSAGSHISTNSCGHLGYTGTSFWLDFNRKAGVVLLTNRIHPTTENNLIREFRPRFHDAVFEGILKKARSL